MIMGLEYALKRPLTDAEDEAVKKLMQLDVCTQETIDKMFQSLFRAGQMEGFKIADKR